MNMNVRALTLIPAGCIAIPGEDSQVAQQAKEGGQVQELLQEHI